MAGALRRNREPVKLARKAHGEIADVYHLLHFALAFGADLARFEADQPAQCLLAGAQLFSEQPHQFPSAWRGHPTPH
jgi:hypothetical protein